MASGGSERPALIALRAIRSDIGDRLSGQTSVRARLQRVRDRGWFIIQCSVAAAIAWWVAHGLLDKPAPFFAPVAAIVCLGMSYGQRLRRTVEILVGVAVGVGVGDLFVHYAGTGTWQIVFVVAASLAVAVFLSGGTLIVVQAGVQSVIVTTLLPGTGAGLSRWVDALIGGLVALVAATVAPSTPLHRPREVAAEVIGELADLLRQCAAIARSGNVHDAEETLSRARRTEPALEGLRDAAAEALAAARLSPLRRQWLRSVRDVDAITEPLDHAVRNVRVLARHLTAAIRVAERINDDRLRLVESLADAADLIAADLIAGREPTDARAALAQIGQRTALLGVTGSLVGQVVLATARALTVDLLEATGLTNADARSLVPPVGTARA